jgi:hypothetical protein
MNKIYTKIARLGMVSLLLFLLSALTLLGQTPTTFNYQAVLRDASGHILVSSNVSIQLVIHQDNATGTIVYSEVHNTTTTEFGLVNLEIGSVTPASFATIDWSAGPYFVEVIVNGTSMGASELLTVPYARYAVNGVPGPQGEQGIQGIQGIPGEQGPPGVIEANSVGSSHVIDNSLTVDDLDAGSVGSSEVVDNSLTANDLATGSVGSDEVIDNSLTAADLAANSVTASEIAAGAVGTSEITNGTIINEDINPAAAIASSKISGDVGIEWDDNSSWVTWNATEIDIRTLSSFTMSIPTSGYVLLTFNGYARIDNESRVMRVGVGTTSTSFSRIVQLGFWDGAESDRMFWPFSVTSVVAVTAGTWTFYANAQSETQYSSGTGMLRPTYFTGIFIPKHY